MNIFKQTRKLDAVHHQMYTHGSCPIVMDNTPLGLFHLIYCSSQWWIRICSRSRVQFVSCGACSILPRDKETEPSQVLIHHIFSASSPVCWRDIPDQSGIWIKHNGVNAYVPLLSMARDATCFCSLISARDSERYIYQDSGNKQLYRSIPPRSEQPPKYLQTVFGTWESTHNVLTAVSTLCVDT